ncbi:UBX-domain-containing protein [Rhizoclosmatium globosum]|uniref:UBX-domain-containing protein n=1 Tax=Rhizoclosmatium globosum TaxID=329046 RepID=A0A1Y2BK28_9FUNG|nr:UBX-domain-containing protein [Rhizoclosmatium globosum]|eukprot:ORY34465.1 UBX-domain-containing protein [Rhizoclosmatium globosum]
MDNLSDEQLAKLGEFQAITGIDSIETALDWMTSHGWDLEKAVQGVFNGSSNDIGQASTPTAAGPSDEGLRRRNVAPSNSSTSASTLPNNRGPSGTLRGPNALEICKRELRCLLVYLHSPEHDATTPFCTTTLASPALLTFLREKRFLVWAGDVRESEAFMVSNTLLTTRYPFLAVIAPQGGSKMVVVERFEGVIDAEVLVAALGVQLARVDGVLSNVRADRERHEQARILREQQEEAYNASLRADQEKARLAQEEKERIAKEKEEEERKQQEILSRREQKAARKVFLKENMAPEPETGEIAKIGIRLPNGERLTRRFRAVENTVQDLYDFVEAQDLTPIDLESEFEVINTYPRRVLLDKTQTIKDAGLYPNSSVMVEEAD